MHSVNKEEIEGVGIQMSFNYEEFKADPGHEFIKRLINERCLQNNQSSSSEFTGVFKHVKHEFERILCGDEIFEITNSDGKSEQKEEITLKEDAIQEWKDIIDRIMNSKEMSVLGTHMQQSIGDALTAGLGNIKDNIIHLLISDIAPKDILIRFGLATKPSDSKFSDFHNALKHYGYIKCSITEFGKAFTNEDDGHVHITDLEKRKRKASTFNRIIWHRSRTSLWKFLQELKPFLYQWQADRIYQLSQDLIELHSDSSFNHSSLSKMSHSRVSKRDKNNLDIVFSHL